MKGACLGLKTYYLRLATYLTAFTFNGHTPLSMSVLKSHLKSLREWVRDHRVVSRLSCTIPSEIRNRHHQSRGLDNIMLNCLHGIPIVDVTLFNCSPSVYHGLLRVYLPPRVCPAAKLKVTFLVIKRKPCNVNLACAFKNAWRNVEAVASMRHHDVGLKSSIEFLISTREWQMKQALYFQLGKNQLQQDNFITL